MIRGPASGNGTSSSVYYPESAGLAPPRALYGEMDPLGAGVLADGSLAAEPGIGSWWGAGGRRALRPLRVALWAAPVVVATGGSGRVAQRRLMNELPVFFQSYASSDSAALNKSLVGGVSVTGLGGALTFDAIAVLQVPPGGATRWITVAVIWQVPELPEVAVGNPGKTSKLEMSNGMSVVDLPTGKWYVGEIGESTKAVGAR
jgi:hypothetical protein